VGSAPPPVRPKRRTQAERRAETRAALLDATIESLVRWGYAGTTTGRVAELAGVSRGAQIPYFKTRDELLAAAVAHLAEERVRASKESRADSVEEWLDVLWEEHQGPLFDATLELWVASRSHPPLSESLRRVESDVAAAIAGRAAEVLGPVARRPAFTDDLVFALATIRGLALLRVSVGDSNAALDELWQQARRRLIETFTA